MVQNHPLKGLARTLYAGMHMGKHLYICLKAVLYCPGKYPEGRGGSWGDANKCSPSECFLNAITSFTYAYSLACQSVVTQMLVKVERQSQDGHLHPIQFLQLGSTLSPEQQPTDLLPPMDS